MIKGVEAGGEKRKRLEKQKKGKREGEGEESGGERAVLLVHI